MNKPIIVFCQNKKCIWNETRTYCTPRRVVRNECGRGGLIRISKEGYCENFEAIPNQENIELVSNDI